MGTGGASLVLDSFALLAYLGDEPGAGTVEAVLRRAAAGRARVSMCAINLGEALYVTEGERGLEAARKVVGAVAQLPIEVVDPDRALTFAAAHIKAQHPLAYADAFAVALASRTGGSVVTGDPEFQNVEKLVRVRWLSS